MGLRCKGKTLLGFVNKLLKTKTWMFVWQTRQLRNFIPFRLTLYSVFFTQDKIEHKIVKAQSLIIFGGSLQKSIFSLHLNTEIPI